MRMILLAAAAVLALPTAAEARAKCKPGQIYRVTHKTCVAKTPAQMRAAKYGAARAKKKRDRRPRPRVAETVRIAPDRVPDPVKEPPVAGTEAEVREMEREMIPVQIPYEMPIRRDTYFDVPWILNGN